MSGRCESCLLNTANISDEVAMAGWARLSQQPGQSSEEVLATPIEGITDEQKRALSACYIARMLTGGCEKSALAEFITADFLV